MSRMRSPAGAGKQRRPGLFGLTSAMAMAAAAGSIGLMGGGIDFGPTTDQRLPFDSVVIAGIALLMVVGVPMTGAAVSAWYGTDRAGRWSVAAGSALVGWIVVQIVVIRTFSWLQPACAGYGVIVVAAGAVVCVRNRRS